MSDAIIKRFLGHEHEIMFRVLHNGGGASVSTIEPGVLAAAESLVKEGYLAHDGEAWPCGGRLYRRFVLVPERVSMAYLKEHL